MDKDYFEKEETKSSLLKANYTCDELLMEDIQKEETPKL